MVNVTISQGKLKGGESSTDSGFKYYEFLGVPYAKPPVGDLRFKSPQPAETWDNVRDATKCNQANIASQVDFMSGEIAGTEDCLYLNIYTPKVSDVEALPVMFYIHGGGFISGNGMKPENGPDFLVENNVVVVTINYRLGIFGFLSLDIPEAAGNMGLKDQVMALQWVQANISKFGGDKNNVTLFGISAGGASVEYLLLSPRAKGLFHKAIMQSGSTLNDWAINFDEKSLTLQLIQELGYTGGLDDNRSIYEFLMKIPTQLLAGTAFKLSETFTRKSVFFGFVPTVEKDFGDAFLTSNPYTLLKDGNFNKVPVMRGFAEFEGLLMNMMKPSAVIDLIDKKKFVDFWSYPLDETDKLNEQLLKVYLEKVQPDHDADHFAVQFFGDLHFSAGIWIASKLLSKSGIPVYAYQFKYDGTYNLCKRFFGLMKKGASHGDDVAYIFRHAVLTHKPSETDVLVRSRVTKMWTNFAKTGNPTPPEDSELTVKWPTFKEGSLAYLNIDKEFTIDTNYEPKRIEIFEDIYAKYEK